MSSKDSRKYLAAELLEVQRTLGWMDLVISSIDDAVCVVDSEGKLVFANDCFADLVDIHRIFLLGIKMKDIIALKKIDNPQAEYRDSQNKLSGSTENKSDIFEWENKQGHKLMFRVASRLLPNSDQNVFLIQNITREYELTRLKNNFVNLASHQLRTPMTAIMTYSHMLSGGLAGALQKDQQEIADTIVQASERMIHLVDGLLKITRVQSDKLNFKKESVSLPTVFGQILAELQPSFRKKKLKCKVIVPADTPTIQNDTSAIHEIFSNLVVNALQYTRESGTITVTALATQDSVITTVRDTGIGIPKEYQSLLFNQFSRADNALEEFSEGTGLGLYLVKILLEKIGGSISFKSKLNSGTTFTVTLPIISPPVFGSPSN